MENVICEKCGTKVPIEPQQRAVKCWNPKCGFEWTREILIEPVIKRGEVFDGGTPISTNKTRIIRG